VGGAVEWLGTEGLEEEWRKAGRPLRNRTEFMAKWSEEPPEGSQSIRSSDEAE